MLFTYLNYSIELDESTLFAIPSTIDIIERYGYYIVLSPENGSWIIIENLNQMSIFEMFKNGSPISEVINNNKNFDDIQYVICQIKGRHLEDIYVKKIEDYFSLRIYLTNNCNLRCSHCFMYAGQQYEDELSCSEVLEIIDASHKNGANKLILTGGEVCLSESFIPSIKHAKELGMYVQVLSNGTCWTNEMLEEAAKYIDDIQISVDGFNEQINAQIRGKNTFVRSIKTVEKFVEKKVFTTIVTTPSYEAANEFADEYATFGKKLVERFGNEYFCIMFGNEIINGRDVKADKQKNREYKNIISTILERIYPNYELTAFIRNHSNGRVVANCGYGTLTINAVGDLYFCGRIFEVKKYGNVRNMTFENIFELRKRARDISQVYNIKNCQECNIRYVCGGGCRIANIFEITQCDLTEEKRNYVRICIDEEKEHIYKMMIESNDYMLW